MIVKNYLSAPIASLNNVSSANITLAGYKLDPVWLSNMHADFTPGYSNLNLNRPLSSKDIRMRGCLYVQNKHAINRGIWEICNIANNSNSSDLVMVSNNGTTISFCDNFEPGVLNFTGKHRCATAMPAINADDLIGRIVISTGSYKNLQNQAAISMDEAIPIVTLATSNADPRVFGVIGGVEEEMTPQRTFKVGNLQFTQDKDVVDNRLIIHSVGEGAIWVCDEGGPLKNGDLIVSGHDGYGVRQHDDLIRNCTVAKITCDCDFSLESTVYKCDSLADGKRRALVGCVYLL
jgi:hypothetical protein